MNELVVDGEHLLDPDGIRQGWVDYFKALATPIEKGNFDEEYKIHIELRKHLIQNMCETDKPDIEISNNDFQKLIKSMKTIKQQTRTVLQ